MGNQSLVLCWEGPRGSGKTLTMTYDAVIRMIRGIKVWSNYNIEFTHNNVKYKSIPIDMDAIYAFDSGVANGFVYIDELPLWVNSRKSMSVANGLMNSMLSVMRHRGLSFGFTSQQYEWLDKRMRYQVDTLASCFDLHFKYRKFNPGVMIGLSIKDISGLTTGYPYHMTGRVVQRQLYAKPFWNCYNSWQEFDVLEAAKKPGSDNNDVDHDKNYSLITNMIKEYEEMEQLKIPCGVLYKAAINRGFNGNRSDVGQIMMEYGAKMYGTNMWDIRHLAEF